MSSETAFNEPNHSDFDTGWIASRTFSIINQNLGSSVLLGMISQMTSIFDSFDDHFKWTGPIITAHAWLYWPLFVARNVAFFALYYLVQAALAKTTIAALGGRQASIVEALSSPLKRLGALTGLAILANVGLLVGFVLLFVPGIILGLMWTVVVPVFVVEASSIQDAFARSSALTKGHRGAILGIAGIFFVVLLVVEFVVIRPLGGMPIIPRTKQTPTLVFAALNSLVGITSTIVSGTGAAVIYYKLRSIKEGPSTDQLAAIFS